MEQVIGVSAASWTDGNPHPPVCLELLKFICNRSAYAAHIEDTPWVPPSFGHGGIALQVTVVLLHKTTQLSRQGNAADLPNKENQTQRVIPNEETE